MITALNGIIASSIASIPIPPSNTVAPVISGTNVVGNTLTTTNGTWTGTTPITYTYQWKRNGSNIVGATASTYLLVQADSTFDITCTITGTNAIGNSSATSNALTIFDANAQLFISAETTAGVTLSTTEKNAVNQLVSDCKSANIWTKFKAMHPIIGGTATAHKFNLVNPDDTNAAYRLSFVGGWTHSSNGALPNGTNAYANTFFTPSTNSSGINNFHNSYYSRTDVNLTQVEMGCGSSDPQGTLLEIRTSNLTYHRINAAATGSYADANSLGLYVSSRISSTEQKGFKNGTLKIASAVSSNAMPTQQMVIAAYNNSGTMFYYSSKQCAFSSIGDGLTDLESQLFYQIVEKYQVALGRNINATQSFYYNTAYNNETNAFLFSTQITDATIQTATNTLVTDLKTANIFTKMRALYPMVGGTATTNKFNLANSMDIDSAFRLTFAGGWTHSSNGALPNGTNAYANTFLSSALFTGLPLGNNAHLSFYSRTNSVSAAIRLDIGSLRPSPDSYSDLALCSQNTTYFRFNNGGAYNSVATTNTSGFYTGSRTATNIIKTFKNGSIIINGTAVSSSSSPIPFFIGASNNNGTAQYFSDKQCAFASLGDGLTDLESQVFYQIVEKFQVALGRNINPTQSFYYNTAYNNETNAFLFSTQITDTTTQLATNTLVTDLKTAGLFTKMKTFYPMVGGTATTHKFNLINSQDSDSAYRLAFVGGWTHSANGALPNGVNAYASTFLIPNTVFGAGYAAIGVYVNQALTVGARPMGSTNMDILINTTFVRGANKNSTNITNSATLPMDGFIVNSRTTSTNAFIMNRSGAFATNATAAVATYATASDIVLGAININGTITTYSNGQIASAFCSDFLTQAESTTLKSIIQTFQITLGRQVI